MDKMFVIGTVKEVLEAEQTLVGWASKEVIDRDKELILAEAWNLEDYQKNPVICLGHDYRQAPVGKCLWIKKVPGEGLRFKMKFAPTPVGQELYQLYKGGFMSAFSVGFMPREGGWKEHEPVEGSSDPAQRRTYTDVDLLEISAVSVPSCSAALVEEVKAGKVKTKEINELVIKLHPEILDPPPVKIEEDIHQKPEETDNYIHIRVEPPDKFVDESFRTINIDKEKGIQAVIGKYKADPNGSTHIQKYIFAKDKGWTMESAQQWVKDNKDFSYIEPIIVEEGIKPEAIANYIKIMDERTGKIMESLALLIETMRPPEIIQVEEEKVIDLEKIIEVPVLPKEEIDFTLEDIKEVFSSITNNLNTDIKSKVRESVELELKRKMGKAF